MSKHGVGVGQEVEENTPITILQGAIAAVAEGREVDPEAGEDTLTRLGRRLDFAESALQIAEDLATKQNLTAIAGRLSEIRSEVKALDDMIESTIRGALSN